VEGDVVKFWTTGQKETTVAQRELTDQEKGIFKKAVNVLNERIPLSSWGLRQISSDVNVVVESTVNGQNDQKTFTNRKNPQMQRESAYQQDLLEYVVRLVDDPQNSAFTFRPMSFEAMAEARKKAEEFVEELRKGKSDKTTTQSEQ
jgi:hypothetical protein